MKKFRLALLFISILCLVSVSGIIVKASSFDDFYYSINNQNATYKLYTNPTAQSTLTVTLNTRPSTAAAVVRVEVNKNNPANNLGYVCSRNFPGSMNVSGLTFSLPVNKAYYAHLTTDYTSYVSGSLSATY